MRDNQHERPYPSSCSLSSVSLSLKTGRRQHCDICGVADMESAFGGRCCTGGDDDALCRVRGGGFGFRRPMGVDSGCGGGNVVDWNGVDAGER